MSENNGVTASRLARAKQIVSQLLAHEKEIELLYTRLASIMNGHAGPPSLRPENTAPAERTTQPRPRNANGKTTDAVVAVLRERGEVQWSDINRLTGRGGASDSLYRLVRAGKAVQVRRGVYRLAKKGSH